MRGSGKNGADATKRDGGKRFLERGTEFFRAGKKFGPPERRQTRNRQNARDESARFKRDALSPPFFCHTQKGRVHVVRLGTSGGSPKELPERGGHHQDENVMNTPR